MKKRLSKFGSLIFSSYICITMFNQPNQNKMKTVNLKATLLEVVTNSMDFDKIDKLIGMNRETTQTHINTIKESIQKTGSSGVMIKVIKTKAFKTEGQLINGDGQHRLEACRQLNVPFNYMIMELEEDVPMNVTQYIAIHNEAVTKWGGDTYLNAYALNGVKEYKLYKKLKEKHNLTNTDMLKIFGVSNKDFKNGTMQFENEANSLELLKAIVKVKPHVPNKAFVRRSLFKVFIEPNEYETLANAIVNASNVMNEAGVPFSENEAEFLNQLVGIKTKMNMKKAA